MSTAVHRKNAGLEDTDNDERASFSLRATLPSHAKLQPPRVGHEQANGTCEAKDVNDTDDSSASGLQQVDQSAEKFTPASVEVATLDQRAVVVPLLPHGTRLVPAVINNISSSKEDLGPKTDVKQDGDQSIDEDEELPNGSTEDVLEIKPYRSHNITATVEGRDRKESHEEEENVSDTDRGTDAMSESGVEEEKDRNRPWTDTEKRQEEEDPEQEKTEEDAELHVQENEMPVEESSVDKERNDEEFHSDQTEEEEADISELKEELHETEQVLKEHSKEDAPKDEKENEHDDQDEDEMNSETESIAKSMHRKEHSTEDDSKDGKENEQDGQDEAEMNPETESIGKEEDSGPVQERGRIAVEKEEDIKTQEQPLRESDKGDNTSEAQVKTELEVRQIQIGDGEEQEPHGNESLDEERTGDGEDGELDPEKKSYDGREREMGSAMEQGDDGDVNTNQKEEQNELRHGSDDDTVSGSSEQEDQFALQAPDAKEEAHQMDSQDDSLAETSGDESVIKSLSEGTETNSPLEDKKGEEQNQHKEQEEQNTPKEQTVVTEEQDNSLPKDQDIQDVSVTAGTTDEENKIKSEPVMTESNPQLEEKSEEEKDSVRQKEPVVLEGQDHLPKDQRPDKVISDDDETQDDQVRKTEIMNSYDQANDSLENEFKQEQVEPDQQQNDTNSPVEHENESGTPETKEESESSAHLEEKPKEEQSPTRQEEDHNIPQEEPIVSEDHLRADQSTDKIISNETQDEQDQDRKTEIMNNHDQEDFLQELEFKQEQAEPDQQQNGAKSPVERVGTPEPKDEEKTESEPENEHCQGEEREESDLPQTKCAEKALAPSGELGNQNHLEEGEEEERGQIDNTHPQAQQLKEEQLTAMNFKEGQNDQNITDGGEEGENESDAQTDTDVHLAKEKGESELKKEEVSEVAADKVQEDSVVGNATVIAVDEKGHNGTKDPVTENVGDLRETEKPPSIQEDDVDQRPDGTQKMGSRMI